MDLHAWTIKLQDEYIDIVTTRFPGPLTISYFIPFILLLLGLLFPKTKYLAFGLVVVSTLRAWQDMGSVDVIVTDNLWWSFYLLVLKDPTRNFKRVWNFGSLTNDDPPKIVRAEDDPELLEAAKNIAEAARAAELYRQVEEGFPIRFSERLVWVLSLMGSRPLFSWRIGSPSHDNARAHPWPPPTRRKFLRNTMWRLVPIVTIFAPLSIQLARNDPYFSEPYTSVFSPYPSSSDSPRVVSLIRVLVPKIVLRPLTLGMYAYSILCLMWLSATPLLLFANFLFRLPPDSLSPHTNRTLFGPFSSVRTGGLRAFWGRFWHQEYRHMVGEPGRAFAVALGLPKPIRYALQCASAFTLSGITHTGVVPAQPKWSRVSLAALQWSLAGFFMLQPVGLALEMMVVEPVLKRTIPEGRARETLRMLWVLCWMSFALTLLVLPFSELGYWRLWPFPGLPEQVRWWLAGEWIP